MAQKQFKYLLNHYYSLTPKNVSADDVVAALEKAGIPERTFYRDRAILAKESADIPGERLAIYAQYFGVEINQLINYKVTVKPLNSVSAKMKTGLS